MKATEILKHEHQAILLVIAAAEKEVESIEKTGTIHTQTVREMADFFKNFVDRCHHAKEEKHLFPMMHKRGMSMDNGPLAVMLSEHEQGRSCVRAIVKAVSGKGISDATVIRKAMENLASYAQLLRVHIDKEDNVLYPMADRLLKSSDQKILVDAFDKVESEELGKGVHEKYHAWIEKLVGK
ncbi:MAG: hemerythrin domain-containing protein [Kiritimatiellae bacterium]|nr:hemerythrin domain-containing protein [Kiritimatiellia bacterium]MDD5522524.1 hemerythrin domain-containing protein [Kiritimatiellia bacterium]